MACRILVPQIGIKPVPPALEVWSPNPWTTREVPWFSFYTYLTFHYDRVSMLMKLQSNNNPCEMPWRKGADTFISLRFFLISDPFIVAHLHSGCEKSSSMASLCLSWLLGMTQRHQLGQWDGSSLLGTSGKAFVWACLVAQSGLTLCNLIDCRLSGFPVHGILQARILEWVAISSFRGSSQPRVQTQVSCIGRWIPY